MFIGNRKPFQRLQALRNTDKVALTQTAINHQVCSQHALCTASQSTRKRYYEKTGLRRQESKTVSLFTLYLLWEHRATWWPKLRVLMAHRSHRKLKTNMKIKCFDSIFNAIFYTFYFTFFNFIQFFICFDLFIFIVHLSCFTFLLFLFKFQFKVYCSVLFYFFVAFHPCRCLQFPKEQVWMKIKILTEISTASFPGSLLALPKGR